MHEPVELCLVRKFWKTVTVLWLLLKTVVDLGAELLVLSFRLSFPRIWIEDKSGRETQNMNYDEGVCPLPRPVCLLLTRKASFMIRMSNFFFSFF